MAYLPYFITFLALFNLGDVTSFVRPRRALKWCGSHSETRSFTLAIASPKLLTFPTILADYAYAFAALAKSSVIVPETFREHPKSFREHSFSLGGHTPKRGDYSKTFCGLSGTSVTCSESSGELNQAFCGHSQSMGMLSQTFSLQYKAFALANGYIVSLSAINPSSGHAAKDAATANSITKTKIFKHGANQFYSAQRCRV